MGALFDVRRAVSARTRRAGAVVLFIAGATMCPAAAETLVKTIHPNRLDVGDASLSVLLTQPMRVTNEGEDDVEAQRAWIEEYYADASVDRLARDLLTSLDTVQTDVLGNEAYRALGIESRGSSFTHLEDGSVAVLEADEALRSYLGAQQVTSALLSAARTADIAEGDIVLTAAGTCPFGDGPALVSDLGLAVEMRRDQTPLLFCVLGAETLYCLASEPTKITLEISHDGAKLDFGYGERGINCEVYEAAIGDGPILLKGANWQDCEITITHR